MKEYGFDEEEGRRLQDNMELLRVEGSLINAEAIDKKHFKAILFMSKHHSAAGINSFTAHSLGNYPSYCNQSNCTATEYIKKGDAEWFYEYFLPNSNSNNFMGAIGPDGSAGVNGTFNRYAFYYSGGTWHILFNGNQIGTANLGTGTSGSNAPVAFGEMANASNAGTNVAPVIFSNLSFFNSAGTGYPVPHGYSYIGYGVGSDKALQNPYGVSEIGSRVNYFMVGSGLQHPSNGYELWAFGYGISITSAYGTGNSTTAYRAYSIQSISEPRYVQLGNDKRAVFEGWSGSGEGSYSGTSNSTVISVASNITETANWEIQYLVTINSSYGTTSGTGWYASGSEVYYSVPNITYYNKTTRYVFENWSNGNKNPTGSISAYAPYSIYASFKKEYYIDAHSEYGNITGTGWYTNGTNATIKLSNYTLAISHAERKAFYAWNNGSSTPRLDFIVVKPVNISAVFKTQYLAEFETMDKYGNMVFPSKVYINGMPYSNNAFLFPEQNYTITGAYYDNMLINLAQSISISRNSTVFVNLPLYNINATFTDLFGNPVNATVSVTFANGTSQTMYADYGRVDFTEVPYGAVNITATYMGVTEHASASNGNSIKLLFVSIYDIAVLVAIMAVTFIIYLVSRARLHRGMKGL